MADSMMVFDWTFCSQRRWRTTPSAKLRIIHSAPIHMKIEDLYQWQDQPLEPKNQLIMQVSISLRYYLQPTSKCCAFWPAFRCCVPLKLGQNTCLAVFKLYYWFQMFFGEYFSFQDTFTILNIHWRFSFRSHVNLGLIFPTK